MAAFRLRRVLGYIDDRLRGDLSLGAIAGYQRAECFAVPESFSQRGWSFSASIRDTAARRPRQATPGRATVHRRSGLGVGFFHQSHLAYHVRRRRGGSPANRSEVRVPDGSSGRVEPVAHNPNLGDPPFHSFDNWLVSGTFWAIVWGGTACAILDGGAASVQFGIKGIQQLRIWQSIASAILGAQAFGRGRMSGVLGLLLHSAIAFTAAAAFVAASHRFPDIARAYLLYGPVYGIVVYLVMNAIVVPLSARPKTPKSAADVLIQLAIHMLFVGLPISIAAARFGRLH